MERVIVTVKRRDEARVRDLEVPAEIEAGQLAGLIAAALNWSSDAAGQPVEYEIAAEPLGRVLHAGESLAEAGVWDGAWLVLQPVGATEETPSEPGTFAPASLPPIDPDGPVIRWRSLDVDLPDESERDEDQDAPEPPSTGYVWKRLD